MVLYVPHIVSWSLKKYYKSQPKHFAVMSEVCHLQYTAREVILCINQMLGETRFYYVIWVCWSMRGKEWIWMIDSLLSESRFDWLLHSFDHFDPLFWSGVASECSQCFAASAWTVTWRVTALPRVISVLPSLLCPCGLPCPCASFSW
jgi:hypothetical protein